jgi:hypothetical protein
MKNIGFALMFALMGSLSADAQSMLRVRLADNSVFNISVDGRFFNKRGTAITVGELPYGRHRLRIFVAREGRRGRMQEEELYSGNVKTYEGQVTLFVYDPNSRETSVSEQDISEFTANHPPVNDANRFKEQYNDNGNNLSGQSQPAASPAKVGTVDEMRMKDLKERVTAKKTDVEKMNLLKEELKNDRIVTNQVSSMMDWFSFETSKVDFAKWAYTITIDREYYRDLENKFSYKNYQEDLEQFLKEHQ